MCSTDEVNVVLLVELADNILSKGETHATVILSIVLHSPLWVGPKQVTKESLEGRLDESVDTVDVGLVL